MKRLESYLNEFKLFYETSDYQYPHIFITAKAGTGKSTLIKMIIEYLNNEKHVEIRKKIMKKQKDILSEDSGLTKKSVDDILKEADHGVLCIDDVHFDGRENEHEFFDTLVANKKANVSVILITNEDICDIDNDVIDDSYFKIDLPVMDNIDFEQLFVIALEREKEEIDQETFNYVKNYFLYVYNEEDVRYHNDDVVIDLLKTMQKNRIISGRKIMDISCFPIDLKDKVDEYLEKEMNKDKILDSTLQYVSNMVRAKPLEDYIQSFLFKKEVDQEMIQRNIAVNPDPILVIKGNAGSGKNEAVKVISRIYYAIGLTRSEDYIDGTYENIQDLIKTAYSLNKLFVIDYTCKKLKQEELCMLLEYYQKGLKVILLLYPENEEEQDRLDQTFLEKIKILNLPDFTAKEMYEIFERICDNNRIIVSSQAYAAIQTLFVLYEKEGKMKNGNAEIARYLYEKINLQRYRRKSIPYYEITLDDVLKTLKTI